MGQGQKSRPGWRPTDRHPVSGIAWRWEHYAGWVVEHQGHPTAHHPYAAYTPKGALLLTGGREKGTAFRRLAAAQEACELEEHSRAVEELNG